MNLFRASRTNSQRGGGCLNILLFPATLIGYLIWIAKGVLPGRGSGVSGAEHGPLSARWFEHHLGTRQDEPANRLMMVVFHHPGPTTTS